MNSERLIPCPGIAKYGAHNGSGGLHFCVECLGSGTIPDRRARTPADLAADEERTTIRRTVDLWGRNSQLLMLVEECSELAAAAVRVVNRNRPGAEEDLCAEVADVEIMCGQMRALGFATPIDEYKCEHLAKLKTRIDQEDARE